MNISRSIPTVQTFDPNRLNPIFDFFLPKVKEEDREDVKSDSILRILTAVEKRTIKSDIFTFAHTIVQRTVFDYYRQKNRKITKASISVNFCDGADEESGSTIDYFSYEVEEVGYHLSDVRYDYLIHITDFTPQERKIIDYMLFVEEGMDMKPTEISNQLGLNKSHASRAMKKLKKVCRA
ncbi:sigma-70 family RNA polymerase sigma factor [Paenibacillus sp. HJL G12]|uniref:Sigma-70 family RNA polymerase sigma factor n=1 Tax=Paenibacillus dendrobii TaxID=2691084 RepID=A0A7X3LFJ7_9BACL|nr:sigma-70 family RNA polymerase sigma factor [Paenibacillus dendrobii]MWV43072.1 sigma-70 family RNA polymerase sigma factor [Paenibacillus dendrobii]